MIRSLVMIKLERETGIELITRIAAIYRVLKVLDTLPELYVCSSSHSHESPGEVRVFPQVAGWCVNPVLLDFEVKISAAVLHYFPSRLCAHPPSPATPRDLTKEPMEID